MRIKQIELNGFKSFVDKTVLEMHPGITAVVGPNGCGKSNIVDAIRWVLGEQSAKNLRGDKMEEVIFNGTENRKQKGMAEVSIILSGVSRELPSGMPIDEVRVTRRLFRSGESEYLINNGLCRLRDIREIFLDTGLELKSYAILEQGRVGDIVNSKPYDRRFLIEEAAGVVKYKVRKQEAVSKLESAQNNLQRIRDIIGEVRRQLNALDRMARKAERYKVMQDEARELELGLSRRDFDTWSAEHGRTESELKDVRAAESERAAELGRNNSEVEQQGLVLAEEQAILEKAQQDIYTLEKRITEYEGQLRLLETKKVNLEDRCARNRERETEFRMREAGLTEELNGLETRVSELDIQVHELHQRLKEGHDRVQEAEADIGEHEEQLESRRKELYSSTDELAHIRNELAVLNREKESHQRNEDRVSAEAQALEQEVAEAANRLEKQRGAVAALEGRVNELSSQKENLAGQIEQARERLESREREHDGEREAMVSTESRLESLREMDQGLTGYREGLRKLIQGKGVEHDLRIESLMAEVIDVEPEHEAAVEALLGERLQSLIMPDHHEARRALEYLRKNEYGRGVFLPAQAGSRSSKTIPTGPGVLGCAADLVKVREPYRAVVANLLSDAVVVNSLDTALSLWPDHDVTYATLGGEVLEPSGLLSGGTEKGLLSLKRQIRELEESAAQSRIRVGELAAVIAGIRDELGGLHQLRDQNEQESRTAERQFDQAQRELSILEEGFQKGKQRLGTMHAERQHASDEYLRLEGLILEKAGLASEVENSREACEADIRDLRQLIQDGRSSLETLRSEATERRVDYNARRTALEAVRREHERLTENLAENRRNQELLRNEQTNMEADIQRTVEETDTRRAELSDMVNQVKEEADRMNQRKSAYNDARLRMREMEEAARKLRSEVDGIRQRKGELEVALAQTGLKIENLTQNILTNYGLELNDVEPTEVPEGAKERFRELREKMGAMGPISLGSLEEHKELSERYEFLLKQQEDLNQSISSLQEAISKINRTTRERLREAYERLREEFQKVFKTLFGGGRADLVLVGEESILEAGLDIIAQPPGKKLQNISLLSGGEKALTAISILFAGFLIKPSPLCVLDEVDAPLDESNTDRFGNMLRGMAENTQFVTITHNRRTMEEADILYGVTMEEPGVSRIISVKMTDYMATA